MNKKYFIRESCSKTVISRGTCENLQLFSRELLMTTSGPFHDTTTSQTYHQTSHVKEKLIESEGK